MVYKKFGSRWINIDTVCSVNVMKSKKTGWRVVIKTTCSKNPYIFSHRYDNKAVAEIRMFKFVSQEASL